MANVKIKIKAAFGQGLGFDPVKHLNLYRDELHTRGSLRHGIVVAIVRQRAAARRCFALSLAIAETAHGRR